MKKLKHNGAKPGNHLVCQSSNNPAEIVKNGISDAYKKACEIRSSKRWKDLRNLVLAKYPLCAVPSCRKPADEVHHIIPVSVNPELAFNADNLLPLCEKDHVRIHAAMKRGIDITILIPDENRVKL